jgi:hypothetical protein
MAAGGRVGIGAIMGQPRRFRMEPSLPKALYTPLSRDISMARKLTKTAKKRIRAFEKDVKDEKKLWNSIEKIHEEDENMWSFLKKLFGKKPAKKAAKKKK